MISPAIQFWLLVIDLNKSLSSKKCIHENSKQKITKEQKINKQLW